MVESHETCMSTTCCLPGTKQQEPKVNKLIVRSVQYLASYKPSYDSQELVESKPELKSEYIYHLARNTTPMAC